MNHLNLYAQIVYLTIVTSLDGEFEKSSPSYLTEKAGILNMDERDAFGFFALDRNNQKRAIAYCNKWKIAIPEAWLKEAEAQEEAYQRLHKMGLL